MKTCSIEWAAGLFEGEGCITRRSGGYPQLKLSMTDFDVVRRFGELVGVEKFYQRDFPDKQWKSQLEWCCRHRRDVTRILTDFLPYFGDRRAYKALNVLDHLELS